jgi:hypothetical protein
MESMLDIKHVKSFAFWDITTCSPLKVTWRFGGTCCHDLGVIIDGVWNG